MSVYMSGSRSERNPAELDNSYETDEIRAYWADSEQLAVVCDLDRWHITDEWAEKFRAHLKSLLCLAESGNPWAQCYVAHIYMAGYRYTSHEELEKNYAQDAVEMTKWLVRAARQGIVLAVDNLITCGVGPEAERIKNIWREMDEQVTDKQCLSMRDAWQRAYGVAVLEQNNV